MNDILKNRIKGIDETLLMRASENNFRLVLADELDYEIKPTDVLYIIDNGGLIPHKMNELVLLAWLEKDGLDIEEESSLDFYVHLSSKKLIAVEMVHLNSHCIAYYSDLRIPQVNKLVSSHTMHYVNTSFFRKLMIDDFLD